jgi:glycosyltransferase involved in cell wall biosynthesis
MGEAKARSTSDRTAPPTAPSPTHGEIFEDAATPITIVISSRERWRFTPLTVQSILDHTDEAFELWLLDTGIPDDVRASVRSHIEAGRLKIVEAGLGLQPNDARALVVPQLTSRYVVFIDNDVVVSPGWLGRLVACADERGAGIVCPLYLWGEEGRSDIIHMAGGKADFLADEKGLRFTEKHRYLNRKLVEIEDDLKREQVDFGEFHCLMMRREVYSAPDLFLSDVVTIHEHIHASLKARQLGFETWFEPDSRVTYLALAPWRVNELAGFRRRWDLTDAERRLQGFARRWGVVDDARYRGLTLGFLVAHAARNDVLDPRPELGERRNQVMARSDLQQTFAGWEYMAQESGYSLDEVQLFARVYVVAIEATNGYYRPCGRPFINHLVGTASVLTYYGCTMQMILASLIHSILDLGEGKDSLPSRRAIASIERLGSAATAALDVVHAYTQRKADLDVIGSPRLAAADVPLDLARMLVLDSANEVEMALSFEAPVSGRRDLLPDERIAVYQQVLESLGLAGLAESLSTVRTGLPSLGTISFNGAGPQSFRIDGSAIVPAYS